MTPATPVPWSRMHSDARSANGVINADTGEDVAICGGRSKTHRNANYIVHTANAYPKMVCLLRETLYRLTNLQTALNKVGSEIGKDSLERQIFDIRECLDQLGEVE